MKNIIKRITSKEITTRITSLSICLVTVLSMLLATPKASAAAPSLYVGVSGISVQVNKTTLKQGEKLTVKPVVNASAKKNIKNIAATINGKTYTLKANGTTTVTLPQTLKKHTLTVRFNFKVKVPVKKSAVQKAVNQYSATTSATITIIKDINAALKALKKAYPQGSRVGYLPKYRASQCHAFGCAAMDLFFNTQKPTPSNKNYTYTYATKSNGRTNAIRPLDLVRYRNGSYDHTIVITGMDSSYFYYCDANAYGDELVRYNQKIKRSTLESYMKQSLNDQTISPRGYLCHFTLNFL